MGTILNRCPLICIVSEEAEQLLAQQIIEIQNDLEESWASEEDWVGQKT